MKKFTTFLIILFLSITLFSKHVRFIRTIDLGKSKKSKKITDFIFGKKSEFVFRPFSIFIVKKNLFGITDTISGNILLIDSRGKIKKKINKFGKNRLESPVSGTAGNGGDFYISDSILKVVLWFGSDNRFKKIFCYRPGSRITGISFFGNKLYCCDTLNHRILVLNRDGKESRRIGRRGNGEGEFNYPTHIAVDRKYLYVTDAMNFRVQIFDHKGNFIKKFGQIGHGGGCFAKPKGIASDKFNRIYIVDAMFDNVQIFDIRGRFLSHFGGPGHEGGKFWMPSGICIDKADNIYVADTYNRRIQVFKVSTE